MTTDNDAAEFERLLAELTPVQRSLWRYLFVAIRDGRPRRAASACRDLHRMAGLTASRAEVGQVCRMARKRRAAA